MNNSKGHKKEKGEYIWYKTSQVKNKLFTLHIFTPFYIP